MSLVAYEAGSSSEDEGETTTVAADEPGKIKVVAAPHVDESCVIDYKLRNEFQPKIDPGQREITYNMKYDDMFAPELGPENPFKANQMKNKNFLTGHVEEAHVNEYQFENQRRIFHCYGTASNPSDGSGVTSRVEKGVASNQVGAVAASGGDVELKPPQNPAGKRRREKNTDSTDVDGYLGPWARFEDEKRMAQPTEEEQAQIDQYMSKKKKYTMKKEKEEIEEKYALYMFRSDFTICFTSRSILHIKDPYDYQGRSFLHAPQDLDVNLREDYVPQKCFLPKKCIHTYTGKTPFESGISVIDQPLRLQATRRR